MRACKQHSSLLPPCLSTYLITPFQQKYSRYPFIRPSFRPGEGRGELLQNDQCSTKKTPVQELEGKIKYITNSRKYHRAGRPLTVYDPRRPDWGADWRNDAACAPFAEQTAWELARAEAADVVVFYFGAATDAPVSLLELGLAVGRRYGGVRPGGGGGPGAAVVVCVDPAYRKRGNVQMVCQRYGVELVEDFDELAGAVARKLEGVRK